MKLLIIGANGQLGWELCQRKNQHGFDADSCDLPLFDITDQKNVLNTVEAAKPEIIINAAAYTAVDQAEKEPETAFSVNRDGVAHLAEICSTLNIPLIHISTDYVFDGSKETPYTEEDAVLPLGIYGESKAKGEDVIRRTLPRHIIIRTSWLYGIHGKNFVKTMLRLGKMDDPIRVVDDQYGCPTSAADLADVILTISRTILKKESTPWGTYHYSNAGKTSWFQFAQKIFDIASGYDVFSYKSLNPIKTTEYPTPARRPQNSVLQCNLIAETFNIKPIPWEESLSKMINRLYAKLIN